MRMERRNKIENRNKNREEKEMYEEINLTIKGNAEHYRVVKAKLELIAAEEDLQLIDNLNKE